VLFEGITTVFSKKIPKHMHIICGKICINSPCHRRNRHYKDLINKKDHGISYTCVYIYTHTHIYICVCVCVCKDECTDTKLHAANS
jgi:hypothetical protein